MTKTLLDGVNDVLLRLKLIEGDAGLLASLTDSGRQAYIDSALSFWAEVVDDIYSVTSRPLPYSQGVQDLTLVVGQRSYDLPDDMIQIRWPLLDITHGREIIEYPGGYDVLRRDQPQRDNFEGLPYLGAINPQDGKLYLDRIPQPAEAGFVYELIYDKDLTLVNPGDVFPFSDAVYRALVTVVAELVRTNFGGNTNTGLLRNARGRAARLLTQEQPRESYRVKGFGKNITDPMSHA